MTDAVEQGFTSMMTDIMRSQQVIRFNMVSAVTEAWELITMFRAEHNIAASSCAVGDYVFERTMVPGVVAGEPGRYQRIYSIRSLTNGWRWMADSIPERPIPLAKHLKVAGYPVTVKTDVVNLVIETRLLETSKGELTVPDTFTGWLYDPKGYFFSKG